LAQFVAFGIAVFCLFSLAAAQVLRDPSTPFGPLVYDNEFTSPAEITGISDGLKNIPLSSAPGWYVNFGGSLRERFESFSNSEFGFSSDGGVKNEDYLLHRLLLSGDFHFGPDFRTFIQFGDELEAGRLPGPQPTDVDRGDLYLGMNHEPCTDPRIPIAFPRCAGNVNRDVHHQRRAASNALVGRAG
jgi:hypothetical protein